MQLKWKLTDSLRRLKQTTDADSFRRHAGQMVVDDRAETRPHGAKGEHVIGERVAEVNVLDRDVINDLAVVYGCGFAESAQGKFRCKQAITRDKPTERYFDTVDGLALTWDA